MRLNYEADDFAIPVHFSKQVGKYLSFQLGIGGITVRSVQESIEPPEIVKGGGFSPGREDDHGNLCCHWIRLLEFHFSSLDDWYHKAMFFSVHAFLLFPCSHRPPNPFREETLPQEPVERSVEDVG